MAAEIASVAAGGSTDTGARVVELEITGMTCGSCAGRIERKLSRLDGVEATVNYAVGRARVTTAGTVGDDDVVRTVASLGFGAAVLPAPGAAPSQDPVPPAGSATAGTPAADAGADELDALRHRVLVCLALTIPVVAVAMTRDLQFRYWQWFSLTLTAPVVVWGGWRFHRTAWQHLRRMTATMDTLVSLGTLTAFGWSLYTLFFAEAGLGGMRHGLTLVPRLDLYDGGRTIYLETAAAVTTALLAGRWIEMRGRRRGLATLRGMLDRTVPDARLLLGDREIPVPAGHLGVGDDVVVGAGETIPVDGAVVNGASALDVSAMTGESVPVEVGPGDEVLMGTTNESGRLVVRATRVGGDTQWARMARRVEEAQNGKAQVERLADRVSAWFVPATILLAVATLGFWWSAGMGAAFAFSAGVAVLVIACPCALGLATPTALMVGTGRGAQLGILLRGPEVLESTRRVDTVVLDKTGTVTRGAMRLTGVVTEDEEDRVLRRAGALEDAVAHPIARAIAAGARDRVEVLPVAEDVSVVDGLGVAGTVDGVAVLVGRPRLLVERGAQIPASLTTAHRDAEAAGATAVLVAWADGVCGLRARAVLTVADTVRETSAEAINRMRALGLRPVLLTGDNPTVAAAVAAEVGIAPDDVVAGVLPVEKAAVVERLQNEGAVVAMVGDGVNDAAALARADLGIAMGTGSEIAIEAGDLTLVRDDLRGVADALRLARRTLRVIRGNLFWAFAYNVAALPLAALGLLNPMIAGATMALSSVFVVANSLRLRRFRTGDGR